MQRYICVTCGNQYGATEEAPDRCLICEDERQYVNPRGQTWITLDTLQQQAHNVSSPLEPGLTEIITEPKFAIGQRALLVQSASGNVLWDCLSLIDDATVATVNALGGFQRSRFLIPTCSAAWSNGAMPSAAHRSISMPATSGGSSDLIPSSSSGKGTITGGRQE